MRTRGDLVEARVAATNQLAALLDSHWPGAKAIFANIESAIALAFLTRYPTAASAASLTEKRLAAFLRQAGLLGQETRRRPARSAALGPRRHTRSLCPQGIRDAVLAQVGVLTTLNTAIKALDHSIAEKMDAHSDGEIFRSFPRAGTINAAQILAEWGDSRAAFDHPDAIAALAGITPVTRHPANNARVVSLGLQQTPAPGHHHLRRQQPLLQRLGRRHLHRARASGKDHPHATRILARAWVRVIWRCWQNNTLRSNPARRRPSSARTPGRGLTLI